MDSDIEIELEILPPEVDSNQHQDSKLKERSSLQDITYEKPFEELSKDRKYLPNEKDMVKPMRSKSEGVAKQPSKSTANNNIYEDFNVMLNLTDISYGVKGHNKFYQIQILRKAGKYTLYTKWGRVGANNPGSNNEEFESKIDTIRAFKKKFREKTLNDWDDRQNFIQKPGKYIIISVEQSGNNGSVNDEITKLNKRNELIKSRMIKNKSNLNERIKSLMETIWDINRMTKTLKELNFDTEKHPLGKLTVEQIFKGYRILSDIQKVLLNDAKQSKIIELSNQFYTNIPQNYGMRKLPPIDHLLIVKEKVKLLDILKEIDIANRFINMSLYQVYYY